MSICVLRPAISKHFVRSSLTLGVLVTLIAPAGSLEAAPAKNPRDLRVTSNHRYFERNDGTPFFYLADTAWGLFDRLNREETDRYLADRAKKGFTVIQAVLMYEASKQDTPNAYGDLPLVERDPERINEAYFKHVDYVVQKAAELGLTMGILPGWGRDWKTDSDQKKFNRTNAKTYGRFLGTRYRDQPVIWILGGDNNPTNPTERQIIEAMATGLREGDQGRHLITFHPRGPGRSSEFFHSASWLDFNMSQSGHGGHDHDNGLYAEADYRLKPAKPTVDGENRYEGVPSGFYWANKDVFERFDDDDIRQAAYWSLLAGACGHTYGNNSIWQFWMPDRKPDISADIPWPEALDHPGAFQMMFVRRLFESRPFTKLAPYPSMILNGPTSGGGKIRAARATDGSFAFVYSPFGEKFTVDQKALKGAKIKEIWYNPRYGTTYHAHTGSGKAFQTYTPPSSGRGQDWILILEDEAENFPVPGISRSK
jgi:hypothetical protein